MNLISISALKDNYIWILYDNSNQCLIVDPGDAVPVLQAINYLNLTPVAIFLTHYHHDHVNGVIEIVNNFLIPVYGPEETRAKGTTHIVNEEDTIKLLGCNFKVISLPGHTLGHIGFYSAPWLFSGDTIFSAGCGRLLEGTPQQMYESFQKINELPCDTLICAAHEYTLKNLNFATKLLHNRAILDYESKIKMLRLNKQPSLPTFLYVERKINPFFYCKDARLHNQLGIYPEHGEEWRVFAAIRSMKDNF